MIVADCSILMAGVLSDEESEFADNILEQLENNALQIIAPALIYLECSNVLFMAYRKKRITQNEWGQYLEVITTLPLIIDHASSDAKTMESLSHLSEKYSLTSYDAAYLELAQRKEIQLATLDSQLLKCAKKIGMHYF